MTADESPRHSESGCEGTFRPVYNQGDRLGRGPDALVCPLCGGWRPLAKLGEDDREGFEGHSLAADPGR